MLLLLLVPLHFVVDQNSRVLLWLQYLLLFALTTCLPFIVSPGTAIARLRLLLLLMGLLGLLLLPRSAFVTSTAPNFQLRSLRRYLLDLPSCTLVFSTLGYFSL